MRTATVRFLVIGLAGTALAGDNSTPTPEVRVAAFTGAGEKMRYTVSAGRLPCKVTWNAETQEFPTALADLVARAQAFLPYARKLGTNSPSNTSFRLRGLTLGRFAEEYKDQWFVAATFWATDIIDPRSPNPLCFKHVVCLLDGTYATEAPEPKKPDRSVVSATNVRAAVAEPKQGQGPILEVTVTSPYQRVREPEFEIPKVQWDPLRQAFPLDLSTVVRRGREHLRGQVGITDDLAASEIHLRPYLPAGAIEAAHQSRDAHGNHWLVRIVYRSAQALPCDVFFLLDGRILAGFRERPGEQ